MQYALYTKKQRPVAWVLSPPYGKSTKPRVPHQSSFWQNPGTTSSCKINTDVPNSGNWQGRGVPWGMHSSVNDGASYLMFSYSDAADIAYKDWFGAERYCSQSKYLLPYLKTCACVGYYEPTWWKGRMDSEHHTLASACVDVCTYAQEHARKMPHKLIKHNSSILKHASWLWGCRHIELILLHVCRSDTFVGHQHDCFLNCQEEPSFTCI